MDTKPQRPKEREGVLNAAIEAVGLAKELQIVAPVKGVFDSVSLILTVLRVSSIVCVDRLHAEMHLGLDDRRGGLRRTWAILR